MGNLAAWYMELPQYQHFLFGGHSGGKLEMASRLWLQDCPPFWVATAIKLISAQEPQVPSTREAWNL